MRKQSVRGSRQGGKAQVGKPARRDHSELLGLWVAFEEDGSHPEAMAELYVGEGISDHNAGCDGDIRELCVGLIEEARERLAAVAFLFVMRAEVKGVDVRALRS